MKAIQSGSVLHPKYTLTLNEDEMEVLAILLNESDHVLADDAIEIGLKMLDVLERLPEW